VAKLRSTLDALIGPAAEASLTRLAFAVFPLLAISAVLLLVAVSVMPPDYSWLTHSISESAAQGQLHAWVARLSFLCFGVAVLLLAMAMRAIWPRVTYWCALIFAGSMAGVASFSHAPWQAATEVDVIEDFLHSLFASGMGFAFVIGVVARLVQRGSSGQPFRALDAVALLAATATPVVLASEASFGGLVQRAMFLVSYIWFGREALIALRATKVAPRPVAD